MILSDSFKIRLKEAMGGESNRSFAAKCDISEMTLRRYLAGENFPALDALEKIAQASGCSLAWLASGEGEMRRGPVEYPLGDTLKNGDILSDTVQIATATAPPKINGIDPVKTADAGPFAWFHEWIDEELVGKSMSEVMRFAVKIKAELDKEREG